LVRAFLALELDFLRSKFALFRNIRCNRDKPMLKQAKEPGTAYIGTPGLCARYDNITPLTARRWLKRQILPQPDMRVNGRPYWKLETLDRHDRQRTIDAADRRPKGQYDGKTKFGRGAKSAAAAE
jgi:hypothetical protein